MNGSFNNSEVILPIKINIEEKIKNITNEILFIGAIYSQPDLLVEYGQFTKSKYDFSDDATRFFYDLSYTLFKTRTQIFTPTTISTFAAEDSERLALFNKYGGYSTLKEWMKIALISNHKSYFEILKKYSLLREYHRNGFDVTKIFALKNFESLTAQDIYKLIRSKADRINTVILTNSEMEVVNNGMQKVILDCMETPDMGYRMPFPIMNEVFRGMKRGSMMCQAALSNAGKSRLVFLMMAFSALVLKEKVCILMNEMSILEFKYCLLTTVINNEYFQHLHGIKLSKKEKEITLGLYKDENGDFLYRKADKNGEYLESVLDFIERVKENSEECRNILKIAEWIENETEGIIFAQDMESKYDDRTLEFEIRKCAMVRGVKIFVYDVLKSDVSSIGDWAQLKATATVLSELAKELKIFLLSSLQLSDDANYIKPDELTSSNIANCKQVKHVLHTLVLWKEIDKSDYDRYEYLAVDSDWGDQTFHALDQNKRYYAATIDKNRFGEKLKLIYEIDLDKNTWKEIGKLIRK